MFLQNYVATLKSAPIRPIRKEKWVVSMCGATLPWIKDEIKCKFFKQFKCGNDLWIFQDDVGLHHKDDVRIVSLQTRRKGSQKPYTYNTDILPVSYERHICDRTTFFLWVSIYGLRFVKHCKVLITSEYLPYVLFTSSTFHGRTLTSFFLHKTNTEKT